MIRTKDFQELQSKPILKWVGGKRQLAQELLSRMPKQFSAYHEPFFGGGALFFELFNAHRLTEAFLSDKNNRLIDVYLAVRDDLAKVIRHLKKFPYESDFYYDLRAMKPERMALARRAARFIYLNKTCYNGLYRENSQGEFNVPIGKYKNPTICDETNLRVCSAALKKAKLRAGNFEVVLENAKRGDFIYFDPPYHPVSKTANFTAYAKDGFSEKEQTRLRDVLAELDGMGCHVMLSNSHTPFTLGLYKRFRVAEVQATRLVNSRADARGKIAEIIVTNY